MANNPYVNKVVKGTDTLIDLTADTVTANSLMQGYTAHDKSGAPIVGTATGGGIDAGQIYQDGAGYIVLDDDSGGKYDPSDATATAADILSPKTAYISGGKVTGSIVTKSSSDLTASGATVTVPSGYYATAASKSVASGSVSASASKGIVTNHSVSVTPTASVTTAGYISSGATGTAVTVSASELVSGTKSITANGTGIDVSEFAAVDVAVPSVSPTLITKSITANGTYNASSDNADGYSSVTVNVSGGDTPSGGGSLSDPIRFFDYDGTLVASYSSVPSSLPDVPTHSLLTNGTWNYTLAEVTTQFNAMGTCDVGANYETASGKTEIDVEFADSARLSPYLRFAVKGTVTIDWGDGSATETVTGTSLTTQKNVQHTYSNPGEYTITLEPAADTTYSMYSSSSGYTLLHNNVSDTTKNRVYNCCVKHVRIGPSCQLGANAFWACNAMRTISIPGNVNVPNSALQQNYALQFISYPSNTTSISANTCYSIHGVSIPLSVTTFSSSAFYTCYVLSFVSIPYNITSLSTSMMSACYCLQSFRIPPGITSISSSVLSGCSTLASLVIPSGVTSIAASAFSNCYGMKEYHLLPTTPPTLANVNAFNNIQSDCIIYVPSAKLNDYKTAENWSTYADYMVGE